MPNFVITKQKNTTYPHIIFYTINCVINPINHQSLENKEKIIIFFLAPLTQSKL